MRVKMLRLIKLEIFVIFQKIREFVRVVSSV